MIIWMNMHEFGAKIKKKNVFDYCIFNIKQYVMFTETIQKMENIMKKEMYFLIVILCFVQG